MTMGMVLIVVLGTCIVLIGALAAWEAWTQE